MNYEIIHNGVTARQVATIGSLREEWAHMSIRLDKGEKLEARRMGRPSSKSARIISWIQKGETNG